ncbi:LAETG motif-containing sortase-dependent surface protein [Streptomyces sp. FXJ1.172]|uniref:LAETG motif-containing sortase-dependent surface protein n=1 Tax=Streptomyces sp. FXJ1.172 TaxID=710705 RepID=UPI0007CFD884|nr:LAETG motif-containing sortase-dependent surface protein [Streptomyces sp. FXJ1.172]WEO95668.1 LAETG motif-containing sortase-dependent surface protein [Streptomyces sp. FXJ1.172]
MSSARRPLLTATAAGTLLCALWFVPSANASQDAPARAGAETSTTQITQQARAVSSAAASYEEEGTELADTGSPDTTPYVVGGTLFLAVGAGFVVYSVRRERLGF